MQLDRIVESVVSDRRAVIFSEMDSAQRLETILNTHLEELKFDVEGRAPRLPLSGTLPSAPQTVSHFTPELVSEYMNWWNVEFEYGSEQALSPGAHQVASSLI